MRLHRSITFWSGLLVLAFLAWAWRDSMHYRSSLSFGAGPREYSIVNLAGHLSYSHSPSHPGVSAPLQWRRYPTNSVEADFIGGLQAFEWTNRDGFLYVTIAIRILMIMSALVWLGLIYWRYRRWKRTEHP